MTGHLDSERKPTILAVDDTPDNLMQIHRLLSADYQIRVAVSGENALQAISTPPLPELVLLDVMMPGIDGYEVCRRLKADPVTAGIPVIFLTGRNDVDDERLGLEVGAADYIAKPISPPILSARVRNHLMLHQRTRKLAQLTEQLSHYLAPQVCRTIFEGAGDLSLTTRRRKLTIFCSGIEEFTETTEDMEPEDLTWLLNAYLTEMSSIAMEYGGTIDRLVGDAMMIFFGDPETLGVSEDAVRCVQMAVAMQQRMGELQDIWRRKGYEKPFQQKIGIHTGFCSVGNFGSDFRMNYTAIGPAVNLAFRLQQAADPGDVLMSYETYSLAQNAVIAEERPPIKVNGIARSITTYAMVRPSRARGHTEAPGHADTGAGGRE